MMWEMRSLSDDDCPSFSRIQINPVLADVIKKI